MKNLVVFGAGLLLLTAGCASHSKAPGTTTTTLPTSTGTPVVVTSPSAGTTVAVTPPAPSASVAGGVHHMVTGEVTDVDRNSGKVNILASDGSRVQVILPPLAVATANKGDRAAIDVTIGPAR
jgi:hypothetical protein